MTAHLRAGAILLCTIAAVVLTFCFAPSLVAQGMPASPASSNPGIPGGPLPQAGEGGELHLMVGRSLVLNSPTRIKRVSVADPNIADAIVVTPNQILINGKAPGGVSLVLWDESDASQTFDVFVDLDILGLQQKVREVFPQEEVRVGANKDVVILDGRASSDAVAKRIVDFVSAATPKVINAIEVPLPPPPAEIMLEVRFAEVNRAAISQFGINFFSPGSNSFGPRSTVGATGTQQFAFGQLQSLTTRSDGLLDSTEFRFNDLLNIFLFRADINLGAVIRALEQENVLQILAEPNLLTQSGKEANFLAGGEFPFPILQAGTTGNAVTIQFKEFGVRLTFMPTLTADKKIHLKVRPEVSALDFANALTISGFLIPALSTRRVETEMELADGQSFAIAGLVDDRVAESAQKVPWLGDIPILGKLFRSRSTNKSKTELLVLVTPRVVKPYEAGQAPAGPKFLRDFLPLVRPGNP